MQIKQIPLQSNLSKTLYIFCRLCLKG